MSPPRELQPDELGQVSLFACLDREQQHRLLDNHRLVVMEKDQQLILEREESQGLFVLRSGLAKVRSMGMNGQETVIALLGPRDVCGEMASLSPMGLRSADVITLTPCSLLLLRGAPFATLLKRDAALALALAKLQAQRLRALHRRFALSSMDASTRLLATLADLATKTAPGATATAPIPPLPQRELACLSGLSRETTSRLISTMRRTGQLLERSDGGLQLQDLQLLKRRGLL